MLLLVHKGGRRVSIQVRWEKIWNCDVENDEQLFYYKPVVLILKYLKVPLKCYSLWSFNTSSHF
jgi:hypothetical protein